ncbi:LOW QUALITY PROTEIN: nuclear factor 7, brain [Pholidichthys leucotaenia]
MIMSFPEEDLTCPVCCDIFTDPVLLSCSHSFCRTCLKNCWDKGLRECPVCRKKSLKWNPPSNLALKNVCEAVVVARQQSLEQMEDRMNCIVHGEKLKLFCLVDKQPICVVCQSSKLHKTHDCLPLEEALLHCKDELALSLKSLQEKWDDTSQHWKQQKIIKESEWKQHTSSSLANEESVRLAAVKKEEDEKIALMKDKIRELCEMMSLTDTIAITQAQLKEDDIKFKDTYERSKSLVLGSDNMSGLLIDVTKTSCNLKYTVWEQMLDHVDYTPVTLDPNTAHPLLILSDDLTSLHYSKQPISCPDNPERFHISAEVVGMTALGSGSHHWAVETGSNCDWLLGLASLSVSRNTEINARPENGFWTLCFRDGELRAMSSPPTPLTVSRIPKQVKVQLDYNRGMVCFFDLADNTLIYTFTHTFTEPLLPYFYTQSTHPLKIMPEKVLVTMLRQ